MPLRLLAIGDLHLGRRPGSLPDNLRENAQARALSPANALRRIVDAAIASGVDVVAFAGDVVEQEDDFFEAYAELRRAVQMLSEAGIQVVGIAGNHDVRVLPHLADELPAFRLLGRGGHWEALELRSSDGVDAVLHGWSFPTAVVRESPLAGVRFERDHRPAIGLLHCDRDQSASPHAPVSSRELETTGLDAWLLGHIHKPDPLSVTSPVGYLGSVTPLRHTETGHHGPWLIGVGEKGIESVEQWPLAPLRWDELSIDLGAMSHAEEARSRMLAAIRDMAGEAMHQPFRPEALGLKLRFTGRTAFRGDVESLLEQESLDDIAVAEGLHCFVLRYRFDIRPEIDLSLLARRRDPLGLVARRLQLLDEPVENPERQALLQAARAAADAATGDPAWVDLPERALSDSALADALADVLLTTLDALLRQTHEEQA